MIFITLGSREYQFNRLLKEVDRLIENNEITEPVFAQIGQSDYVPKHYEYKRFLSPEEFGEFQDKANIVITHGGTGAIISALKKSKRVIAVPRLAKYKEHTDDHQLQVTKMLESKGYIISVEDITILKEAVSKIQTHNCHKYERESCIMEIITRFISNT